ncbi:MAG: serine/threonine-protein kinase [Myxococcota bacterium]
MSERLGRYEIVGELATGGMAEILLARKEGPGGFERAVAIKRILPNFVNERSFVDMFVDEARIAARINHTNVVHYEELGQDEGQLYLVMEYLEGESALSLQRRARARGHALSFAECAYVVAQAASGLHAAHEMNDLNGNPLDIVHRDISPQNIFITYRGEVKVMDFGIAKAADRITVTEAGALKGKFAYMSPEQADGANLDRRSDVFSLGIVLYELTTGRRLFRRATPVATLRAASKARVVAPSSVVPDYPSALEEVCLKALAKDRSERYQTADEFRRALLVAIRVIAPDTFPQDTLPQTLVALFSDRIEEKRRLLRKVSSGSVITSIPSGETEVTVELPSVEDMLDAPEDDAPQDATARPALPSDTGAPARRRPRLAAAAVAILTLVGGALAWSLRDGPAVASVSGDGEANVHELADEPANVAVPTASNENVPAQADMVEVHCENAPATVYLDGLRIGESPVQVPRPSVDVALELRHEGFETLRTRLRADGPDVRTFRLTSAARPARMGSSMRRSMRTAPMQPTMASNRPGDFPVF